MLYFGYGSNMNRRQLLSRCATAQFRFRGKLPGYRLAYTRYSPRRRCGVLDLLPCRDGEVWGGVFSLQQHDWQRLDEFEFCCAEGYRRVRVEIQVDGNPYYRLPAIAYEVCDKLADEVSPSDDYLAAVLTGARQCGLPDRYLQSLSRRARELAGRRTGAVQERSP